MMRRVSWGAVLLVAVMFSPHAGAVGPVTAPITEWPIPASFDFATITGEIPDTLDKDGNLWFSGIGHFAIPIGRFLLRFEAYTLGRLTPRTDTFTFWLIGPSHLTRVTKIVAAPDGTIFVLMQRKFPTFLPHIGRFSPASGMLTEWRSTVQAYDFAVDVSSPHHPLVWTLGQFGIYETPSFGGPPLLVAMANQAARLDPPANHADTFAWAQSDFNGCNHDSCLPAEWKGHLVPGAERLSVDRAGTVWLDTQSERAFQLDPGSGQLTRFYGWWGQPDSHGALWGSPSKLQAPSVVTRFVPSTGEDKVWFRPTPFYEFDGPDVHTGNAFVTLRGLNMLDRLDPSMPADSTLIELAPTPLNAPRIGAETWPSFLSLALPLMITSTRTTTSITSSFTGAFEEFSVPTPASAPLGPAASACNAFFVERDAKKIGRLKTSAEVPARDLESAVNALVEDGHLTTDQGDLLDAQVEIALSALNSVTPQPDYTGARDALNRFIDIVNGLPEGGPLRPDEQASLVNSAVALINGCTFVD